MKERYELNLQYLIFGAQMKKQVEILYRYLDNGELLSRRYGAIQPIKWVNGRKGVHVLAWDTGKNNWRRFAVENIERVLITDMDWTNNELEQTITH